MFIQTQLLIFLLGSMPVRAFAEEASTVLQEDETVTTNFKNRSHSGFEEMPTLLPTRLQDITDLVPLEELMTTESAVATNEDGENSTDPDVVENAEAVITNKRDSEYVGAGLVKDPQGSEYSSLFTNHIGSTEPESGVGYYNEVGGEPETPEEKDGLETVALVGIIVGIIIAIGIVVGIIIAVVRKMSGRYSP